MFLFTSDWAIYYSWKNEIDACYYKNLAVRIITLYVNICEDSLAGWDAILSPVSLRGIYTTLTSLVGLEPRIAR